VLGLVHRSHAAHPEQAHDAVALMVSQVGRDGVGDILATRLGRRGQSNSRQKRLRPGNSCKQDRRLHLCRCLHGRISPVARARMGATQQFDEAVAWSICRTLLARRAGRDVDLDGGLRVLIERAQGKRRQLLNAGMNVGDGHRASPWEGERG
jgi:hypothetical protein